MLGSSLPVDVAVRMPGVDTPRLDAELLLAEALGVGREQLVLRSDEPVEPAVLSAFEGLVERRAALARLGTCFRPAWFRPPSAGKAERSSAASS